MKIELDDRTFIIESSEESYNVILTNFNNITVPKKFIRCKDMSNMICGRSFSHYILYKMANALKMPYIAIFEDGISINTDKIDFFKKSLDNVPDDWSILKLNNSDKDKKSNTYNDYWFSESYNTAIEKNIAYIVKCDYYEELVKEIEMRRYNKKIPINRILKYVFETKYTSGMYILNNTTFV